MKHMTSLLVLLFLVMLGYGQKRDLMYIEAYRYIDSITETRYQLEKLPVNSCIEFINISIFKKLLANYTDSFPQYFEDTTELSKKFKLQSFKDSMIDSVFNSFLVDSLPHETYFLTFSLPAGKALLAKVTSGLFAKRKCAYTIYKGDIIYFLIIFDENNKIKKVFEDTVMYR
jgi:hypothetical protein